jgi:uncharacterized protein with GYD domain
METFISFGNYTQQGIANMKDSPARLEAVRAAIESTGGRLVAFYLTLGRYDFVVISEAPNAAVATTVVIAAGAQGNVRTETLRAFTEEEYQGIVANLP